MMYPWPPPGERWGERRRFECLYQSLASDLLWSRKKFWFFESRRFIALSKSDCDEIHLQQIALQIVVLT